MCDEIRELGFERIEASHGLSLLLVPGIIQSVEEKRIVVQGVHNYCPSPLELQGDAPDAYQFTSHREWERSRCLRLTLESMEFAASIGARYIVLHMGRVGLLRDSSRTKELERMARHGALGTQLYARRKGELMRERRKKSDLYFGRAKEALYLLRDKAEQLDIRLGVEGRSHMEQVPSEGEMLRLMEEFAHDPYVVYWHDFGHIQRKHNLLMLDHDQYLKSLQPHIYGAHVNDVQWPARDHRAPFMGGDVDFSRLIPRYFKAGMPLTWELSSSIKPEIIREVLPHWDALLEQCVS